MHKDFFTPQTFDETFQIINQLDGSFSYYAGGVTINWRGNNSDYLIALTKIIKKNIIEHQDSIEIGAGIKLSELEALKNVEYFNFFEGLVESCGLIAYPQIRNMATLAGNLISQFDFSDTLGFLYLSNPDMEVIDETGIKIIKLNDFINPKNGRFALPPKNIINSFIFKKSKLDGIKKSSFVKESRMGRDIATLNITVMKYKSFPEFDVALGSYWLNTECFLKNESVESLMNKIETKPSPKTDMRASSDYRKNILKYLIETAIAKN